MAGIQEVQSGVATTTTTGAASQRSSGGIEDRFLKLLVAQMKNQDPLNPLNNAEVTSQMAQISTVQGIEKLNEALTAMAAGFQASQALGATQMIGRGVLAPGDTLRLANGDAVFGADLAQPVDRLVVTVSDRSGAVLHRMDLGPQKAGLVAMHWDGATDAGNKAPDGGYRFSLVAEQGGRSVAVAPLALGRVEGVAPGADGVRLGLAGGGSVALADVKQIF